MNNCPSISIEILLFLERYHQNSQAVLAGNKHRVILSGPLKPVFWTVSFVVISDRQKNL